MRFVQPRHAISDAHEFGSGFGRAGEVKLPRVEDGTQPARIRRDVVKVDGDEGSVLKRHHVERKLRQVRVEVVIQRRGRAGTESQGGIVARAGEHGWGLAGQGQLLGVWVLTHGNIKVLLGEVQRRSLRRKRAGNVHFNLAVGLSWFPSAC